MVGYRRNFVSGGTFFFTVNLRDRSSRLLVERIDILREVTRKVRAVHAFEIVAAVVLPDHLHALWRLPVGDHDFALRWRLIKSFFTKAIACGAHTSPWQNRFWEHTIRDERDLHNHINYIHWNPVKHGHVEAVGDWPHSSLHRYLSEGLLPLNWADVGRASTRAVGFGEREG